MGYTDWEKYNKLKSNKKPSSKKKTSSKTKISRKYTIGKPSTKKRKKTKKQLKSLDKVEKVMQSVIVLTAIAAIAYSTMKAPENNVPENTTPTTSISESIQVGGKNDFKEFGEQKDCTETELLNYKDYCYYDYYGKTKYLYCPEEYVLKLAEYSIDKLNKQFKDSGMKVLENGECIPDVISPELLAGICMMESSYRVERHDGLALGKDRNVRASNRAEGMMQQKPGFVSDANRYSKMHGGNGYSVEDRHNPLKAMEICVTNLTRIYRAYLMEGSATNKALTKNSESDDLLIGAMIIAYYQGEGNMTKWAKSGILDDVIEKPHKTNSYGAAYYRTVKKYMKEIDERQDSMEQ